MNFDVSNKESERNRMVTTKQSISGLTVTQCNRKHLTGPMTVFLRSYGEQTKSLQYWVPCIVIQCMFILRVPTVRRIVFFFFQKVVMIHIDNMNIAVKTEGVEQLAPGTSRKFIWPPTTPPSGFFK